ncbi:MAG: HAD-IB family hydrolase [Gammaproteobacteria bacterium]|nr:HAD-IB family hydrolase [Gammaproteobacteria bacterium]
MSLSLAELLDAVRAAPRGPQVAALFDLDRTLLSGFSAQDALVERALARDLSVGQLGATLRSAAEFGTGRIPFVEFVNRAAADLAGRPDADNMEFGRRVFERRVARRIYPEARRLVEAHRAAGHTLVVVSSATPYQVEPVAQDLGIHHALCTRLEVVDGICTGRVHEPACYGPGKLDAATRLGEEAGFRVEDAFFYSDGYEDVPLLEAVARPCTLNPDARLTRHARAHGWPLARFHSRDRPGITEMVRTGLAYGSLASAGSFGLADLLLNHSPRHARNVSATLWGELATAALDVRLDIRGEEHLWSQRPAVFTFNHQSQLDAVVMARLLQRDFTGIAKKEVLNQPFVGQAFRAAGAIFIDRADRRKAIAAMRPAVEALQSGTSIMIAPEGTRSPTRTLGPFKKGAFHMAMQAGVPLVPVVLHDTSDLMPKGTLFARSGIVEVEVLPPVDTSGWLRETIGAHVEEVRALYLEALGQS